MRDDGYDGTGFFGMEALEEPLEIGVATSDGGDGVGGVLALADVDAVVGVGVAAFSYLLWVGYLFCFW